MSDENKKRKSRKWIVKALIIFLVIMGILTFFSNTIMNMTLTQVSTQQVYGATLSSISRATGTLHAGNELKVKAPGEMTIADVPVYLYQEVEEGDVLATFEIPKEHADLDEARESLKTLEKEMEYDARKPSENSDYYDMEMAVYDAEKAVKQAEKNLAAAKNKETVVAQTKNDIKAIQDQLTQLEKDKAVLESKKQELESRRDAAYEKIEMAKETLTAAQDALASCITDPSDPNFDQAALDQANQDVAAAQKAVEKEQSSYNSVSEELKTVCSQLVDKEAAYTKKSTELEEKQADLTEFEQITTVEEAERALKDANLKPEDVDYINVHGTSTHVGDISEAKAIKEVFGEAAYKLNISSTKSMTGHLLGAAGGLEAMATILAIQNDIVPPTINHTEGDNDEEIDYNLNFTFNKAQKRTVNVGISNTFGFGGHNACVVFKKYN